MKICKYCGTEYDDGLDKCPNCGGNKVFSARELEEEANQQQKEIENQERAAAAPAKKKNTIIGVIAAVVVVIAAIVGFSIYKANQPLSNGMTKDEAQGIFDSGVAFMDAGQYEDAIDTFLQLPSDSKKYAEAQELLAQSQDSYRADIISRVDSQVANGDYDSAFSLVEKAQSILPGDAELQNAYDNTYSAYRATVLAKADEYSQSGQYKMALEYLAGVQTTFADDVQIQDAYDNINLAYKEQVRTMALTDADNYVASADYVSAINTLNSAIDEIGQDEEVAALLGLYLDEYRANVISQADAALQTEGYQSAISIAKQGLELLADDSILLDKITEIETYAPVDLLGLETFYGSPSFSVGSIIDTYGNEYNSAYLKSTNWGDEEFSYFLNGEYNTLSGQLYWSVDYKNYERGYYCLSFYDDERLLYTTPQCTRLSTPIEFSFDISGVQTLTVQIDEFGNSGPFKWGAKITVQK